MGDKSDVLELPGSSWEVATTIAPIRDEGARVLALGRDGSKLDALMKMNKLGGETFPLCRDVLERGKRASFSARPGRERRDQLGSD